MSWLFGRIFGAKLICMRGSVLIGPFGLMAICLFDLERYFSKM